MRYRGSVLMKSKQVKNIPELRFPEFLNDGEWEEKELIDISDFINEKIALNKLTLNNYISTENLLQDFSGVAISSKLPDVKTVTHFKENDILISNIRPYLKKVWSASFDGGASNDVIVVRAKENTNNNFLTYLLKNEEFINYVMQGAKGVKMPRGDISLIKKYPLHISPKPKEQQKIADCLSSIDNLITASTKKCETLKQHKKALMQQLFPTDGEEVPKLRFPEFENTGKWEEKRLGDIGKVLQGYGFPEKFQGKTEGEYPFYKVSDISNAVQSASNFIYSSNNYIDENVLTSLKAKTIPSGVTIFAKIGEAIRSNRRAITTQDCLIDNNVTGIKAIDEKATDLYIFYTMSKIDLIEYCGGVVPSINKTSLENIQIFCPPTTIEQQKIADCLSSIDELITASAKKGLMQQLFPSKEVRQ